MEYNCYLQGFLFNGVKHLNYHFCENLSYEATRLHQIALADACLFAVKNVFLFNYV